MGNYTPALLEIEYRRMFNQNGHTLANIRWCHQILKALGDIQQNLAAQNKHPVYLSRHIRQTKKRLSDLEQEQQMTEAYKREVSINNPENTTQMTESAIINAAYERAYAENQR